MTNFAETKVSDVQTFDVKKAQILALELGYYQPQQTALDAETIYENRELGSWRELRQFFVGQGHMPLNRFIKGMSLLNRYSVEIFVESVEQPAEETIVTLGSVGIYAVETGYGEDRLVVTFDDIPQQAQEPEEVFFDDSEQTEHDDMTPEELEEAATRLLKIADVAQGVRSTTPAARKEDEGPWLRAKPVAPQTKVVLDEPIPFTLDKLPSQNDETLRKEAEKNEGLKLTLRQNLPSDGELEWQENALCAVTDPEAFFPEKGGSTREAKRVCTQCDVRVDCLGYAIAHDERFGIWGGLSERERRKLKKAQEPKDTTPNTTKRGRKPSNPQAREQVFALLVNVPRDSEEYFELMDQYFDFRPSQLTTQNKIRAYIWAETGKTTYSIGKLLGMPETSMKHLIRKMREKVTTEMREFILSGVEEQEVSA